MNTFKPGKLEGVASAERKLRAAITRFRRNDR